MKKNIPERTIRARSLRQNQTETEKLLWANLRSRKFLGKKFNRQFPIVYNSLGKTRYFIADFYCHEHKLVIEADGGYHNTTNQKEYDEGRDAIMQNMGLYVLRVKNEEGIEIILNKIKTYINNLSL